MNEKVVDGIATNKKELICYKFPLLKRNIFEHVEISVTLSPVEYSSIKY